MYQLKLMGGDKYLITKEEAQLFSGKSGLIYIPSLSGLINTSSITSILPEEKTIKNENLENTTRKLKDGTIAYNKFGTWVLANNHDSKIDLNYYPELKDKPKEQHYLGQIDSKFSKEMKIKTIK